MMIDPSAEGSRPKRRKPVSTGIGILLGLAAVTLIVLRADWWNWYTPRPLLFGILPVGLWWQAMVSVLATLLMWALVRFAWPEHLENVTNESDSKHATKENP